MMIKLQKENVVRELRDSLMKITKPDRKENFFSIDERMNIVVETQGNPESINLICSREGISEVTLDKWTTEFLKTNRLQSLKVAHKKVERITSDERMKIVLEGKNGETSIAEICRREGINQDTFLQWSETFLELRNNELRQLKIKDPVFIRNKGLIIRVSSEASLRYFENFIDISVDDLLIISKSENERLNGIEKINNVLCLKRLNDIRYINKYFEKVNEKLPIGGVFIGCLETLSSRRNRKVIGTIPILGDLYFMGEFFFKRILPKLPVSKRLYFDITKGKDRLLSKAEALGRLVSSGFKIMDYKSINGLLYFVVKKDGLPKYDLNPSYGPLYKMPRLGKNGKIIGVYKFRTMHPYSEYLQDYILKANGYAKTGKPSGDFRIPYWGKVLRKYWLDELPQLLNVLKGELKLVGIRPVSERYFQDIPKEMQKLRLSMKPGCIPPYVALDRDSNVMSVLQSEKDYMEEKIKNPYSTDLKYFFRAVYNIIFNNKRSA